MDFVIAALVKSFHHLFQTFLGELFEVRFHQIYGLLMCHPAIAVFVRAFKHLRHLNSSGDRYSRLLLLMEIHSVH